jgi:dethiobiotin synthetase
VVVGSWPEQPDLAERSNLVDLPRLAGIAGVVGRLPEGAGRLNREEFLAMAQSNLSF